MKALRTRPLLHRIFCWMMALYVLNVSIDPPDPLAPKTVMGETGERASINEMESIGEVFLEKVLNIPNAVPEQDDPNHPLPVKLVKSVLDWITPTTVVGSLFQEAPPILPVLSLQNAFLNSLPYSSPAVEIDSPPPQLG